MQSIADVTRDIALTWGNAINITTENKNTASVPVHRTYVTWPAITELDGMPCKR